MQRLLSRRHFHSSAVSLPSFPSLAVRSSCVVPDAGLLAGVLADEVVLLDLDFSCPDLDELPPELEGLEDEDGWLLAEWEISSLCSQ